MPDKLSLRAGEFKPASVNREARTARLMFSSGAPVARRDLDGEFVEVLAITSAAVRLDRLNNGAPLLDSHQSGDLEGVLGVVERAWVENGQAFADVRFRQTPEADAVLADVEAGTLRNASVGYVVHAWQTEERDGKVTRTATDWEPFEISLVPIPAEAGAGVRNFATDTHLEGKKMPNEASTRSARAERTRITEIQRVVRIARLDESVATDLIESGVPLDKARAHIVDMLAEQDDQTEIRSHVRVETGSGDADFRAALVDGLLLREGVNLRDPHPAAVDFRRMGIRTLCETMLSRHGIAANRLDTAQLVERALTTSDLPDLLANVAEKAAMIGFVELAPATHRVWTREGNLPDFKEARRVALSEAPGLQPVREHAEITSGKLDDAAEPIRLETHGRILSLTRQAVINDDLGELTRIPAAMGAAARRLEADLAYGCLISNPTMRDGTALFHADHGNLADTGAALSVESLGAARAAMRQQKGLAGESYVDPVPAFLIVPTALETKAEQLLAELTPNSPSNAVPDWIARLVVVADPRLDDASATAWYLAADPVRNETVEVATLDGGGFQISTRESFRTAAMEWRILFDVGAAVLDWRGLYRNPGA